MYNVTWLVWVVGGREQVRFTNQLEKDIPLPDAQFLAIHAAIPKVLHLSGAAKPLDLVMDKFEFGI